MNSLVCEHGYLFLRQFEPSQNLANIITVLGTPETLHGETPYVREVGYNGATNNTDAQPFKDDAFENGFHSLMPNFAIPPRYAVVRCISADRPMTRRLLHTKHLIEQFGSHRFYREIMRENCSKQGSLHRTLDWPNGQDFWLFRMSSMLECIAPDRQNEDRMMQHMLTYEANCQTVDASRSTVFSFENKGDTLIWDNWMVLHQSDNNTSQNCGHQAEFSYLKEIAHDIRS